MLRTPWADLARWPGQGKIRRRRPRARRHWRVSRGDEADRDQELVARAHAGDEAAWEVVLRRHYRPIWEPRSEDLSIDAVPDDMWMRAAIREGAHDPAEAWQPTIDIERALASLGDEEHAAFALMKIAGYNSEEAATTSLP
jgi:DNA-directed RNA polymerase specialized sigma24 family protein